MQNHTTMWLHFHCNNMTSHSSLCANCSILLMKYSRTKFCPELETPRFCTKPFNRCYFNSRVFALCGCGQICCRFKGTSCLQLEGQSEQSMFVHIEVLVQQTQGGMSLPSCQQWQWVGKKLSDGSFQGRCALSFFMHCMTLKRAVQ